MTHKPDVTYGPELNFDGNNPPAEWPSVSLCMIVKNEADNLADCLASLGDFPAEVIIVDTGSSDDTVAIAESLGARVFHFAWIDDFAAARNESIRHATGDWVMWMDADDRLEPDGPAKLKQAVASGQADVYMCRVTSQGVQKDSPEAVVEHLRLFRNGLGIRFRGALHETIMEDARRLGLTISRTNITIEHTGYDIDIEEYRAKSRRNLAIINQRLADNPGDLYWRYHRASSLTIIGEMDAAVADYEAVIADPPPSLNWDVYVYQAHTGLMNTYFDKADIDNARRVLKIGLERFPERRHLAILAGIFYLTQDELDAALDSLLRAKRLSPKSDLLGQAWMPGKLEWVLGQVYVLQGRLAYARDAFMAMLDKRGQSLCLEPPAALSEAEAMLGAGDVDGARAALEAVVDGCPPAMRLLARVENRAGRWRSAAACLCLAMGLSGVEPGDWESLAEYIVHTRHFESAARLCGLALQADPNNAVALNLLGFIAIQQDNLELAMAYLLQAQLADPSHGWVQDNLREVARLLGLSLPEAVHQFGLRMVQQKQHIPAATAGSYLIQLAPTDPAAYKLLALALNGLGQTEDAALAWQTAEQLSATGR